MIYELLWNTLSCRKDQSHFQTNKNLFFKKHRIKFYIRILSDIQRTRTALKRDWAEINQSFETIAALRLENSQYLIASEKTEKIESLQKQYETLQKQSETEQITAIAREKFAGNSIDEHNAPSRLINHISSEELSQVRLDSHRQARIALEPTELNEPDKNSESHAKALEFADALEKAHQAVLRESPESEIAKAFTDAEMKRQKLDEYLKIENQSRISSENKPCFAFDLRAGTCTKRASDSTGENFSNG